MQNTVKRLTHDDRRARRDAMAKAVKKGKSIYAVAHEYGVTSASVERACRENGVNPKNSRSVA